MNQLSGGNMGSVKQKNRAAILRSIRRSGGMSRVALSTATGLSKGGLTPLVEELLALGLIQETQTEPTAGGRRPIRLEICPDRCQVIALDWTRKAMRVALVDFKGALSHTSQRPAEGLSREAALRQLRDMLLPLKAQGRQVIGISVVAPGPLNPETGMLLSPPNFGGLRNVPIKSWLEEHLCLPVFLDNNASAHALAEKDYGHGLAHESFLHVVVDDGIGGAMITDGGLYRGAMGSELGHMTIQHDGPLCPCGNTGCAELYASIPALLAFLSQESRKPVQSWEETLPRLLRADLVNFRVLEQEAAYLSSLLVSAVNLLAPQAVVLGSQLADLGALISRPLEAALRQRCFYREAQDIPVLCSTLESPSLRGGASLVFESFLSGGLGSYEAVLGGFRSPTDRQPLSTEPVFL